MSDVQPKRLSKGASVASWIAQVVAAGILGQTLFFKFSGAPESVYIFSELGAEPWGRIGSGVVELLCVVLLLLPRTAALGALLTLGTMAGAIGAHVVRLGIEIKVDGESDGGLLFALALVTVLAALVVLGLRRASLPIVGSRLG